MLTTEERDWLRSMPLSRRHPNRIRVAAAYAGKTIQELADTLGVSRWTAYKLTDGETVQLTTEVLQRLAETLGVELDDLFSDRPDPDRILSELPPK